jgi:hypothetical protein
LHHHNKYWSYPIIHPHAWIRLAIISHLCPVQCANWHCSYFISLPPSCTFLFTFCLPLTGKHNVQINFGSSLWLIQESGHREIVLPGLTLCERGKSSVTVCMQGLQNAGWSRNLLLLVASLSTKIWQRNKEQTSWFHTELSEGF